MKLLLVAFVSAAGSEAIVAAIRGYESWARINDTCYLVYTHHSPECLRDSLKPLVGPGGQIYITTTGSAAAWVGLAPNVGNWIHSHQR